MNRDFDRKDNRRKNHYADFDQYGNPRTGNTNSLSRRDPEGSSRDHSSEHRSYDSRDSRSRMSSDARAYGDFSGGTRYGEGGSTYGGGSAYGDSYYGMSGNEGPRYRDAGRSRSGDERHGFDDRDRDDYSRQNYGRSGGNNYSGRMSDDSDTGYRGTGYIYGSRPGPGSTYSDRDRDDRGYDRGYRDFGSTGYGSTGYNNRDEDRMRSISGNYRNEARRNSDSDDNRRYNRGGHDWNFDRRDINYRDWND
ncbi:hypothetical protein [uncultured Pontibacter sp.]|uniref:hypothetical protein n=1 Tax=uncultured Pontibacter sp. TaxID=453356 RepID=UPI002634DEF9|nr:hypothetical protein [uncultured Pontibacter sp.]